MHEPGASCTVEGCERPRLARGVCSKHYHRLSRYGDPLLGGRQEAVGWRTPDGYRKVYDKDAGRDVLEHRKIMELHLGRALLPEESVHHVNGVRDDNRLENLEMWSSSHPKGQRVADKLEWAREILSLYERKNNQPEEAPCSTSHSSQ